MGAGSDAVDPITNAPAWDVVKVAGKLSPGICRLSGFDRGFGWQVKKGKGAKGSTVTLNEYPPAEGTITFYFWEQDHFEAWREFRDIWNYDPTKKPINAVEIYHPALADLDIKNVVCKKITAVEPTSDPPNGYYKATVDLIEYNPPPKKPAVATPKHADGGDSGSSTANAPIDLRNGALVDILKASVQNPFST